MKNWPLNLNAVVHRVLLECFNLTDLCPDRRVCLTNPVLPEGLCYSQRLCSTHGPAEELRQNPPFPHHETRTGEHHTWAMSFCKEGFTALLFHQVTLCSNTVSEYYRSILVDVEGAGKKVLSLTVMGRYQHFPGLPQHTALHRLCWLQLPRRSVA